MIKVPEIISQATGIRIFGKLIKSLAFTTDVAIIKNINANAIIAVYPFTPQPAITHAIMAVADVPVFCGVGGGITGGKRTLNIAQDAEFQGAMGVVVNAPTPNETIEGLKRIVDIPIVITVISEHTDFKARLKAGADIFNVSGGANTAAIVKLIRRDYPYVPIIATGGVTTDSISVTIEAGANAITYTPPAQSMLLRGLMEKYRSQWDEDE
ncbi:MAG: hydrolase [Clostridiales bacterium]|nr:hydrolase [Clostridiales bacterium]